jgi:tryptophan synthase alpha chain
MGYYNPLLALGLKRFVERIRAVDIAGLIIPDLPLEEADDLLAVLGDIPLIQMVAPTTPKDRIAELAKNAGGFIYLVSITGITGSGSSFALNLPDLIAEIRQHSDLPICIGFGIDSAQKASQTAILADGVIVGTHVIKAIGGSNDPVMVATTLAREFRVALKG